MTNNPSSASGSPQDHGVIAARRGFRLSWVWLFPIMAAFAASVMFYKNWREDGPTLYVEFESAPGMKPEKTLLFYRGVVAGRVTGVQLDKNLDKAVVKVKLKKYAEDLAREGTVFWIDQPVFNLAKPSGIQSLIEGNSLQAKKGAGQPAYYFIGSNEVPLDPLEGDPLMIRLIANGNPFVERGSEITFRGITVGMVRKKGFTEQGDPYLDVAVTKHYAPLVRSNARFWILPPWTLKMGSGIFELDVDSLKNFLLGGIALDYFDADKGNPVAEGYQFPLLPNKESALAVSEPVVLEFKNAQGIREGMTQLRYLGVPVGLVEKVTPSEGKVLITARLRAGYEFLRRRGSVYSIVKPILELQKVSGLETIVSGIYIDCIPGAGGAVADRFSGTNQEDADLIQYEQGGFDVVLRSSSTKISAGTPVLFRGVRVGKITRKELIKGGAGVNLTASIKREYASLLRENTRFWNAGGVKISGGLIQLNVQASALESRALGGVEFATPDAATAGDAVRQGHVYDLYDSPKKDWLQWIPQNFPGKN
jgi:paraquat-inducible protein B